MSYFEKFEIERFGRAITESGVYQCNEGQWFAFHITSGGGSRSIGFATSAEARANLWGSLTRADRFWWEKWELLRDGDRAAVRDRWNRVQMPETRNVLRVGGWHYIPKLIDQKSPRPAEMRGFAGRMVRWRWLDEPEGTVHFSDDVFTQGEIPSKFRHLLPDNAVFITGGDQ